METWSTSVKFEIGKINKKHVSDPTHLVAARRVPAPPSPADVVAARALVRVHARAPARRGVGLEPGVAQAAEAPDQVLAGAAVAASVRAGAGGALVDVVAAVGDAGAVGAQTGEFEGAWARGGREKLNCNSSRWFALSYDSKEYSFSIIFLSLFLRPSKATNSSVLTTSGFRNIKCLYVQYVHSTYECIISAQDIL